MSSSRGRPLKPETKKLVVSVKQYFDRNKFKPMEPSVKRTADAFGIGDEPAKMRGRPIHAVSASNQEAVRAYIRTANKKGGYITYFPRIKNAIFFEFILTAELTSNIRPLQYLADSISIFDLHLNYP